MNDIVQILSNKVITTGATGWLIAQLLKTVIFAVVNHNMNWERLIGDGGMPSAHTATVTSMAMALGFECGFGSPIFGLAFFFAIIVMHDAMGVRLETGKQAKVINEMIQMLERLDSNALTPEETLKELVGHTPLQVAAGLLLGIVISTVLYL